MSVNLGTVTAYVKLDFSQLVSGAAASEATMKQLASAIAAQTAQMAAKHEAQAKQMAESMKAQQVAALGTLSDFALKAGAGLTVALGAGVVAGASFEKTLMDVRNNTLMTDADFKLMTATVKDLGAKSGAPLDQLAKGFMHITNFGINAKDSVQVLDAAMKSAVATGSNVESTANILAAVLHGFGLSADMAARAMNTLHVASALGNQTLEQFNQAAGPTLAFAAALGVPLQDAAAAMSALTRHGFDAAEAATQVRNVLAHTIQTSNKAQEALQALSKASGIDLVKDFSAAGLEAKGLDGVLKDLQDAAAKAGVKIPDVMSQVIPAMRGGIGAMVLSGRAAGDYKEILGQLGRTMRGELDPITKQYADSQGTLRVQFEKLKVQLTLVASDMMTALKPAIESVTEKLRGAVDWFKGLNDGTKNSVVQFAALTAGALVLVGGLGKVATAIIAIRTALLALPALIPMTIAVALVGTGAYMLATRKTKAEHIADQLHSRGGGLLTADTEIPNSPVDQAWFNALMHRSKARMAASSASYLTELDKGEFDEPKKIPGGKSMKDLLGGGDGGGGGAASKAKEVADAVSGIKERIFELKNAGNDWALDAHKAWKQYQDDVKDSHNKILALDAYQLAMHEANKKRAAELKKAMAEVGTGVSLVTGAMGAVGNLGHDVEIAARTRMSEALEKTLPSVESLSKKTEEILKGLEGWAPAIDLAREAEESLDAALSPFKQHLRDTGLDRGGNYDDPNLGGSTGTRGVKNTANAAEKESEHVKKGIQQTFSTLSGFVAGAFDGILTHQKNWAKAMLQEFIHMVEQMIAEWLVFEAIVGIFGGGAVGHKSFFKFLGFDDPVNDRMAYHQGIDFGRLLRSGLETSMTGFRPAGAAFGGGGSTTIQVHFSGDVHNHGEGTAQQLGEQIAWHAQQLTRTRVGS